MSKSLTYFLSTLVIILASGCSTKPAMFISASINPLKPYLMEVSDGYHATYYILKKGVENNSESILFFIGGSEHASKNYYLRSYFKNITESTTVYALQKRYIGHRETGLSEPSELFHQYNYYSQLVKDQKEFIQYILSKSNHSNKKIIILGVSEGGNIAAQLASEIPQITHLVTVGSGGMVGIDEFRVWGKKQNIDFDIVYKQVKQEPDSVKKKILGQTYKYWSSVLPINPMNSLKKLDIPILSIIGERDEMTPIESVSFLGSEFERLGKENLTVKIVPDSNHVLKDSSGKNNRGEIMKFSSEWWKGK